LFDTGAGSSTAAGTHFTTSTSGCVALLPFFFARFCFFRFLLLNVRDLTAVSLLLLVLLPLLLLVSV
jgi:hypothetical protein